MASSSSFSRIFSTVSEGASQYFRERVLQTFRFEVAKMESAGKFEALREELKGASEKLIKAFVSFGKAAANPELEALIRKGQDAEAAQAIFRMGPGVDKSAPPAGRAELHQAISGFRPFNEILKEKEKLAARIRFLNRSYPLISSYSQWQQLKDLRDVDKMKELGLTTWTGTAYCININACSIPDINRIVGEAHSLGLKLVSFDQAHEESYQEDASWMK